MKYLQKSLLMVATAVFLLQSCVNRDYDWDNMDTSGVFNIPPVMLGNIETIRLAELPIGILPPNHNIILPPYALIRSYVFENFFEGDVVDSFFFEGAGTVEIAGTANLALLVHGAFINLYFNILDGKGEPIPGISIPPQHLVSGGQNQPLSIRIEEQFMPRMTYAQDLEIVLVIAYPGGALTLLPESYLQLNEVIVRTGGIRFEL